MGDEWLRSIVWDQIRLHHQVKVLSWKRNVVVGSSKFMLFLEVYMFLFAIHSIGSIYKHELIVALTICKLNSDISLSNSKVLVSMIYHERIFSVKRTLICMQRLHFNSWRNRHCYGNFPTWHFSIFEKSDNNPSIVWSKLDIFLSDQCAEIAIPVKEWTILRT